MHEMGIANSIIEAVRVETAKRPAARVVKIAMRIGELAGVDRESLSFCFEALTKETDLERAELAFEQTPRDELEIAYLELEE